MDSMLAPGMDRLLQVVDIPVGYDANGNVNVIKDGRGIHLDLFFQNILLAVDNAPNGTITVETAREAIDLSHGNLFDRMNLLYQDADEDGVSACIRAVMTQLVLAGLLIEDSGVWRKGPKFQYDKPVHIVQSANGQWFEVTIPREISTELTLTGQGDLVRQDIKAFIHRLRPDGPGLRTVTKDGVETIKKSLHENGLVPGYPILYSEDRRLLLSGRHRVRAEKELKEADQWDSDWGETWPTATVPVEDDFQAIRIAMAGNYTRPWYKDDFTRLAKEGLGSTKTETTRRLLEMAFIEDPGRDTDDAAALIGCSERTARKVRDELRRLGKISAIGVKPGRTRDEALWESVRVAWLASPEATQENIATQTGCTQQFAGKVKKALIDEELLVPKQRGRGRKSKEPKPPKSSPEHPTHEESSLVMEWMRDHYDIDNDTWQDGYGPTALSRELKLPKEHHGRTGWLRDLIAANKGSLKTERSVVTAAATSTAPRSATVSTNAVSAVEDKPTGQDEPLGAEEQAAVDEMIERLSHFSPAAMAYFRQHLPDDVHGRLCTERS